jgi:dCTP deaminase
MILSGAEIVASIKRGDIVMAPYCADLLNPNSYNYRLGDTISEIEGPYIDPKITPRLKTYTIPQEGMVLLPHKLYLGHTYESIGSSRYVTSLIGRSSVGRLGMFLQITADLGQLGDAHKWTLEIKVVQPLRVYPGMKIGQVSFWEPKGDISQLYRQRYTAFSLPKHSKYPEEMTT